MLRTRSPLSFHPVALQETPFDLHVLATPPAFVLSQDQTLRKNEEFESLTIRELRDSGINDLGHLLIAQHRFQGTESSHRGKLVNKDLHRSSVNNFLERTYSQHSKPLVSRAPELQMGGAKLRAPERDASDFRVNLLRRQPRPIKGAHELRMMLPMNRMHALLTILRSGIRTTNTWRKSMGGTGEPDGGRTTHRARRSTSMYRVLHYGVRRRTDADS